MSQKMPLVPTGIPGFDELLGGGIPQGHTVSLFGGPGAGKTIFAAQFLYNGATQYSEPGVFVSLDETPSDLKKNLSVFGWNLDELEEMKKLVFLDMSPFKRILDIIKMKTPKEREYSIQAIGNVMKGTVKEIGARRAVIDPLSTLILQYPDLGERRLAMMHLLRILKTETDCTSLITMDLRATTLERQYQLEEYLTQGSVLMQMLTQQETGLTRVIRVEKMRGIDHDTQPHPYTITQHGLHIFAKERVYATTIQDRMSLSSIQ